jgi:hypothetical protein
MRVDIFSVLLCMICVKINSNRELRTNLMIQSIERLRGAPYQQKSVSCRRIVYASTLQVEVRIVKCQEFKRFE